MKKLFTPRKLFWFRVFGLILVFIFLVFDFWLVLHSSNAEYTGMNNGERLSHYYAYFTTQSNYIVFLYFVFYLFQKRFKNTKPDFIVRLAVTVYITLTMVVFWSGLFTQGDIVQNFHIYDWLSTAVLHTVIPISMIVSFCITSGDQYYKFENHHKGNYWLICLYPIIYLICVLIRGYIRHLDGQPDKTLFPYFFLNWYSPSGIEMLTAGCVLVFVLCTLFQYFFIWINNIIYFHQNMKHHQEYKIEQIKIVTHIKRYKTLDKKGHSGIIISFVLAALNIVFSILFFTLRGFWSKYLSNSYNSSIILAFSVILIILSCLMIIFGIMALRNLYYARIILGFIAITLICFSWIWIAGPILSIVVAFLCLSTKQWSKNDFQDYLKTAHNREQILEKTQTINLEE